MEPKWLERGIKEAIYTRAAKPSLNHDRGLRYDLSGTWDRAVRALPPVFRVEARRECTDNNISSEEASEKLGETVNNQ